MAGHKHFQFLEKREVDRREAMVPHLDQLEAMVLRIQVLPHNPVQALVLVVA